MLEALTQYARPDIDWPFALITLTFRFFAVFFVLGLIQVGLQISSRVLRRIEAQPAGAAAVAGAAAPAPSAPAAKPAATAATATGVDDETAAAIAVALDLEQRPAARKAPPAAGTSAWTAAGRAHQHRSRPR
jgi:hypothetical protein